MPRKERAMKITRNQGGFERRSRGRRLPIVPVAVIVLLVALFVFAWSRGGEQPQKPVEKAIPAESLGK